MTIYHYLLVLKGTAQAKRFDQTKTRNEICNKGVLFMALGFSDLLESYENDSELYDTGCSLLATSDDKEYAEIQSEKHEQSVSPLGTPT